MAEQARIQTLEEEVALAQEVSRSHGEESDNLRRQLRAKDVSQKQLVASERLSQVELSQLTATVQDLQTLVGALRDEIRSKERALTAEKEARGQLGEQASLWQRQLGEAASRIAEAEAAEKRATERAAASDAACQVAATEAELARSEAAATIEAKATLLQEAAASGERQAAAIAAQLRGAEELVREQASELAMLRESVRAKSVEVESRGERLQALGNLLESAQTDKTALSIQLGDATHEVWEGALQHRLRREQTEGAEARVAFLQSELTAKDERLRAAERDAAALRVSLREQHAAMAETEQTLQKVRVIEVPALRDELRHEQSRATAADAKTASLEAQLASLATSLAEARQAGIDKEHSVAHARSLQLAAETTTWSLRRRWRCGRITRSCCAARRKPTSAAAGTATPGGGAGPASRSAASPATSCGGACISCCHY